jgi:hypothetical protein
VEINLTFNKILCILFYKKRENSYNVVTTPKKGDSLMNIVAQLVEKINQITNFSDLTKIAKLASEGIVSSIFLDTIQDIDNQYFEEGLWKENYTCNGFVERHIITPLGKISFNRRYYMNKSKEFHDHFYYVDKALEIPAYKRISKEALVAILNMAVEVNGSYAARMAIPGVTITKQTVSNYLKLQNTISDGIPTVDDAKMDEPLEFDVIYIEADEAHVNLQRNTQNNNTSEIKTTQSDAKVCKSKNIIDKLVLTHTGHKYTELHLKRKELDNKHYFGGINMQTSDLSDNVFGYLSNCYDLTKTKYIFISGDGAYWIKSFGQSLTESLRTFKDLQVIQVLDKFHCAKYLNSIFGYDPQVLKEIRNGIYTLTPKRFQMITDAYFAFSSKRNIKEDAFNQKVDYILSNLQEIKNQKHEYYKTPCSMEGHVSHVLANRLTSRPKGFCEVVLKNLTQMIIHKKNGKDITTEMLDSWSKIYQPFEKPKHMRLTKEYKNEYSCYVQMPAQNSTCTNLKRFVKLVKYDHSKFRLS